MTQPHLDEITGTLDRFLFQNQENGYGVFILQESAKTTITVTGYAPGAQPGQRLHIKGKWVYHPKFGKQFEAQHCSTSLPTTPEGLIKYLASGLIKGIGKTYAERLVEHFGLQVLEVIDKEPRRLAQVPGIGPGRLDKIIKGWQDQKEIAHVMVFLQSKNISPAYATKIYKKYGQNSVKVVQENPYRLADDIWGIGFKVADQIAQNLGLARDSLERVKAGILFAITTEVGNGHLYVEVQSIKEKALELLELEESATQALLKQALHGLYNADKIKLISHNNQHFITLTQYYFSEKGVALKIKRLQDYAVDHGLVMDKVYAALRAPENQHIVLNDEQQLGIMTCLQHKVTVITGGPGTGKTTLVKTLLNILDHYKLTYRLAAPTGRAAKRMSEGTHRMAATLHRLLGYDAATHGFTHNESNALKTQFLIIDEASMIDIFLANSLLKAVPLPAHVVFIGDVDQLPSVGAGNFLHDLIASNVVTTVRLKQIFRQAQDSLIVVNAHRINNGEYPTTFLPDAKRDFIIIKEDDPAAVPGHLETLLKGRLQKLGIAINDATILVPMNRGVVGTQMLNHTLQTILNPGDTAHQIQRNGYTFKVGDRVMQIRNNYDKNVFNGDVGTITSIDLDEGQVVINYYERPVEYEMSELDELVLAYAISIHKSQGSEYGAVIILVFMQHFMMLQRNLIYTALTRAKKICILIGQPRALEMAIKNNKGVVRTTFLKEFLTTDLSCR